MKIFRYLRSLWRRRKPLEYAKRLGVKFGEGSKLVDNPNWGSEPYLIEIGKNCLLSGGITFINHDRSIRVFKIWDGEKICIDSVGSRSATTVLLAHGQ